MANERRWGPNYRRRQNDHREQPAGDRGMAARREVGRIHFAARRSSLREMGRSERLGGRKSGLSAKLAGRLRPHTPRLAPFGLTSSTSFGAWNDERAGRQSGPNKHTRGKWPGDFPNLGAHARSVGAGPISRWQRRAGVARLWASCADRPLVL